MRKSTTRTVRDPMACITRRTPLADDQAWCTLACSFNIALLLAEYGISANAIETIKLAQDALLRARERANRTGTWAFDGEGARVVMATANIHDEQLEMATKAQIVAALFEVRRRIDIGETA